MAEALLSDLLVVELCGGVAGGYCCSLLERLGAEVIRVEPPTPSGRTEVLPYARYGGKSVTLDISKPEGADLLRRLAGCADVLVTDCDLPLAYEALSRQNPRLMLTHITEASNGDDGFTVYFTGLNAFAATMLPLVNMSIIGRGQEVEVDGAECLAAAAFVVEDRGVEIEWPEVSAQAPGAAPTALPGDHNDEIYGGLLGLSGEELARLKEASVI